MRATAVLCQDHPSGDEGDCTTLTNNHGHARPQTQCFPPKAQVNSWGARLDYQKSSKGFCSPRGVGGQQRFPGKINDKMSMITVRSPTPHPQKESCGPTRLVSPFNQMKRKPNLPY